MKYRKTRPKAGSRMISCNACGKNEFERSLSEKYAIVRLSYTKDLRRVVEKIIKEGVLEFSYECNNCRVPLLRDARFK